MKRALLSVWLLLLCCGLNRAAPAPVTPPAEAPPGPVFPLLGPGLTYQMERDGAQPWAIFVLKIERAHTEYHFVSSMGRETIFGLASVPEQAKSLPAALGTPVAAVNGDWFEIQPGPYQGDLDNMFIYRGQLVTLPTVGDTFWLDGNGQPHVDHVSTDLEVSWPDGTQTPLGLDCPRADNAAVLYTPILGPSTRTSGGRELVLERDGESPWLPLTVGEKCTARVREVRETGDTPLAPDSMILSLGPKLLPATEIARGDVVRITVTSTPDLTGSTLAIGGKPMLLKDGKIQSFGPGEQPRHPRTMLGWNDTTFFLVVVDGRRSGWSIGMTVPELAALAQRLGCSNAINFDGGGSSTLWIDNTVMNLPSDGQPRRVGNSLVLVKQ